MELGDTLASAFAQGEMYIGNWSSKKGAEINVCIWHKILFLLTSPRIYA